ncbi:hypothetical protein RF55_11814 [Lasius niger]|uniref:Uncharacterized protein n=1 Tax=Lasius niger TaxID=67767 RepID=A0A0J7KEQ1_LASNI|nr:hypothetical protein RF55_11814 [Lasius niger]
MFQIAVRNKVLDFTLCSKNLVGEVITPELTKALERAFTVEGKRLVNKSHLERPPCLPGKVVAIMRYAQNLLIEEEEKRISICADNQATLKRIQNCVCFTDEMGIFNSSKYLFVDYTDR